MDMNLAGTINQVSTETTDSLPDQAQRGTRGVTRDQLYELVWTVPMRILANRFGMSDRGLAKLCERHAIPVPGRGYWRRKETGHPVRRLKLPRLHPNHQQLAAVDLPEPHAVVEPRPKPEPPPEPPPVAEQRRFEVANPIVVGELPERPHPLVRATRAGLRKLKVGSTERIRAQGDRALDVSVTAETRDRALRFLEALCQALKARGLPVVPKQGEHRESQTIVLGVPIAFCLEERMRRQERPNPPQRRSFLGELYTPFEDRYDYLPTGELILKAWVDPGSKHKWADGKRQRIEDRLNEVMVDLVSFADHELRWREERAERERQAQAEAQRRWEAELRRREEERRGKHLAQLALQWQEAQLLRQFLSAIRLKQSREGQKSETLNAWLAWADRFVAAEDPLSRLDIQVPGLIL